MESQAIKPAASPPTAPEIAPHFDCFLQVIANAAGKTAPPLQGPEVSTIHPGMKK